MEVTTGAILSRMFAMVRERFAALVGLWLVYTVAVFGVGIVLSLVMGASMMAGGGMLAGTDPNESGLLAMGIGFIAMMVVMYLVYVLIYLASYASLAHMASPLVQPDFGTSLTAGLRAALPLLGAALLLGIGYLVVFGLFAALAALGGPDAGGALGVVLILLVVPVALYLGCRLSIQFPLAAVEGLRNPVTIIARSWRLTSGSVLSILGAVLVYIVVVIVLFLLAFVPVLGSISLAGSGAAEPGIGVMIYTIFAMLAVLVLVTITGAALQSAIHASVSDATGDRFADTFG